VARKLQPALGCAFYRSETGAEPVRAWLRSLDPAVRLEIGSDVEKVQWRWPVSKPLVRTSYEVRTALEGNIYRVFFCIAGDTMVLLHGFMKKTQKAPAKEVDLARARQKEVQRP
jgi:phage-related protein